MASRLARVPRGLVSSAQRTPLLRPYASVSAVPAPQTQITTLPNGFTIATESTSAPTASLGCWVSSGSRADIKSGTAHFLEHVAFKGTQRRSQHALELEVENLGAQVHAFTSREQTTYYAKCFRSDAPQMVDLIADMLLSSKLEESAIERERDVILRESQEVDNDLMEVVFDNLHSIAFQGQPLGQTILGPKESILSIQKSDLEAYIKENYVADRMVLVGAGGVDHNELVKLAEKHFGSLPTSANPLPLGQLAPAKKSDFIGSDVRIRDDTMPTINLAIAVEGVGWSSPDYFNMLVMQSIFGNWDRSLGSASLLSSKLSHVIGQNNLANSFMSFSTSYSDTGLWGIYMVSENFKNLDDLCHFTLKEWQRMSIAPLESEVERAKAQLKASLLLGLDGTTATAEDIGRQMVTSGRRMTPSEIEAGVDAVSTASIQSAARKYIWDRDIAIAAIGQTEGLFDYMRIRADMSSLRF
ncbi:uncharacterized protein L969DRAFT_103147 [Mixia osmundae IAM 14324]|uniref:mitochondrial processing peptidase n=1 Tax=Mixia osmundae (strain CBS 9802 / IAM 14324 / JCM 22182 / KY 12970) TaxID=764103 RepID=G7E8D9_MIXOS|nr:uncharacterized protein L969DRAFT_103147 [Mixia osmundae IAM 14324]KEI39202.1 hypothetical protein L969DRAFT_103147 [Mixia osmundae IAM 14324]GAA99099.1 hypothetical protein E5Q_05788 [Mixia osmundae IAM 14324]